MEDTQSETKAPILAGLPGHAPGQAASEGERHREYLCGLRRKAHLLALFCAFNLGASFFKPARSTWTDEIHYSENGSWRTFDQGREWDLRSVARGEYQGRAKGIEQEKKIPEQVEEHQGKTSGQRQPLQPVPGDPKNLGQERKGPLPRGATTTTNPTTTVGISGRSGNGSGRVFGRSTWRTQRCQLTSGGSPTPGRNPGVECPTEPPANASTDAAVHGIPNEPGHPWRSRTCSYAASAANAKPGRANTPHGTFTWTPDLAPQEHSEPASTQRCEKDYAESQGASQGQGAASRQIYIQTNPSQTGSAHHRRARSGCRLGSRGEPGDRIIALAPRAVEDLRWHGFHQPRPPDLDSTRLMTWEKGERHDSHEACEKSAEACEKRAKANRIGNMPPVSSARTLAIEADLMMSFRQTMNHQENDPPDPGRFGLPTEDDRDDGIPRVNGQTSHEIGDCVNLKLWRPARPGREHQLQPVSHLIHFNDDDDTPKAEILDEEAPRVWPDLLQTNWIHLKIHPTWTSTTTLELGQGYQHRVIIDSNQLPPFTNWRGGMLNVELAGLEAGILELDTGPTTTRVPLSYADLMVQLNIPMEHFQVEVFINGIQLLESTPPVAFGHGFFMEVKIKSNEESSQGSEILRQLLRTPLHRQHEPAESESMTEDDADEDESESAYDVSQGSPRSPSDTSHHAASPPRVVHSHGQDFSTPICTKPIQIHLQDLVHSQDMPSQPGSPSPNSEVIDKLHFRKHRISLDLLLPVGNAAALIDQPDPELCAGLIQHWPLHPQAGLPEDQPFVKVTTDWIDQHPYGLDYRDFLHIFTDGSAKVLDNVAAWAIVITSGDSVIEDLDNLSYHGWLTGRVIDDPDHPQYIGSHKQDSTTSESTALFWAHLFALSCHGDVKGVIFHFDALVVGRAMDCSFNISEAYPIERNLRALMQATESIYTPQNVFAQHVKGHKGHPLNEFANTLAFAATGQDLWEGALPDCTELIKHDAYQLKWLWISARRTVDAQCMPPSNQGKMIVQPRTTLQTFEGQLPWTPTPLRSSSSSSPLRPHCNLISFNVRTLKEPESDPDRTEGVIGRQILLETQFDDLDIAIAGLQETRAHASDTSATARYVKYRSAADRGHGGTELWIHKQKPIFLHEETQIYFKEEQAVVTHASEDLLVVRWTPIPGHLVFLWVGHAPHKGHDDATREEWWNLCHHLLQDKPADGIVLGFLDANAAVGSGTLQPLMKTMPEHFFVNYFNIMDFVYQQLLKEYIKDLP